MRYKILVIDDDKDLQISLKSFLLENNYLVDWAESGNKGIKLAEELMPDLVILDLGLPDIDGETVCIRLKREHPDLPVIILTARGTPADTVKGLESGADEYIAKPFDLEVLLAYIKTKLKQVSEGGKMMAGDLELDQRSYEVIRNHKRISVSPTEYQLLEYLLANKGKVLSREAILNRVWSYDCDVLTRVVDVYIGYLRRKIDIGSKKKLIHCVRGFGYMIKD